jgi:hypothetical protein
MLSSAQLLDFAGLRPGEPTLVVGGPSEHNRVFDETKIPHVTAFEAFKGLAGTSTRLAFLTTEQYGA